MASQNVKITLNNVQCAFIAFDKPRAATDGEGDAKYGGSFLIPKDTKAGKKLLKIVEDAIDEVKQAKWGDNPPKLKPSKMCLRDGDDEDYDGFEDHMYVRASNARKPTLVDRDKSQAEPGLMYSGCIVNAIISVWAQDNQFGKRINASLEGVQYVKGGTRFGPAPVSADEFEDISDEVDDEDEDDAPKSKSKKRNRRDDDEDEDDAPKSKSKKRNRRDDDEDEEEDDRKRKSKSKSKAKSYEDDEDEEDEEEERRRRRKAKKAKRSRDDDEDDDV